MAERVAQDRVSLGCFWAVAVAWTAITFTFALVEKKDVDLVDFIVIGLMFLGAAYSTYNHWRFPNATLVIDAPIAPGHAFRGRIETPLRAETEPPMSLRLRAMNDVRRGGMIWSTAIDVHAMRGERGLVVPIEVTIPQELADDARRRKWVLTLQARVPLTLYRASFILPREAPTRS